MSASDLLPSARAALVPAAARAGKRALATLAGAASFAAEEALRAARAGLYFTSHTIDGEVLPAFKSLSEMRGDVEATLAGTMTGDQPLRPRLEELGTRASAGRRYEHLVHELGGALFGSAVYPGEQVLRANDVYRLSYLPPKRGVERAPAAVFFLAGFIPYGDRLFRFLPEANLYDRFLKRFRLAVFFGHQLCAVHLPFF